MAEGPTPNYNPAFVSLSSSSAISSLQPTRPLVPLAEAFLFVNISYCELISETELQALYQPRLMEAGAEAMVKMGLGSEWSLLLCTLTNGSLSHRWARERVDESSAFISFIAIVLSHCSSHGAGVHLISTSHELQSVELVL